MPKKVTAKTIEAQNIFSDTAEIHGEFNFSLSGTWAATVFLQRSFDAGVTWLDIDSYTANTELVGSSPEDSVLMRFGVKTGGFTSGAIVGRVSQ